MDPTAIITGASRGLGLALTRQFLANHWQVVPVVRKDEDAKRFMALPDCFPIVADITADSVQERLRLALKPMGPVGVLINNAGMPGNSDSLADTPSGEVLALLDVHCLGALRVTQAVMPYLAADGIIINVSSRFGSVSRVSKGELDEVKCSYAYRIAKAAQNMLTQCLCQEFKDKGIRICAIHPGRLRTASASADADRTPEEAAEKLFAMLPRLAHGSFHSLFEEAIEW